jgi:hypothetical protein
MWFCSLERQHGSGVAKVRHETGVVEVIGDRRHFHGGKLQPCSRVGTNPAERPKGHSALVGESGSP